VLGQKAEVLYNMPVYKLKARTLQRKRRGSTSPPLVNIEANPGPKRKASRKLGKAEKPKWQWQPPLTQFDLGELTAGVKDNKTNPEIASSMDRAPAVKTVSRVF
jgi:hypothetical protein